MTIEERLDALELNLQQVLIRLGMSLPDTSHLTPEQIEAGKKGGLIPVGVGSMSNVLAPNEAPRESILTRQLEKIAKAQAQGPIALADALARYPHDKLVPVHLPWPASVTDHEDYTRIMCPKGWQQVPERFLPQLQGCGQVLPAEMRG